MADLNWVRLDCNFSTHDKMLLVEVRLWECFLCGQVGAGGAAGFNRHYIAHHNEERERDGARQVTEIPSVPAGWARLSILRGPTA